MDQGQREFAQRMHTRRCPACLRSIVKNGGCDNMCCSCGHHFRWSSAEVRSRASNRAPLCSLQVQLPPLTHSISTCWSGNRVAPEQVEVPCTCINVSSKGSIPLWGHTCPGAAPAAHAKLAAWRVGLVTAVSPCVILAAPVVAVRYGVRALAQCVSEKRVRGMFAHACVRHVTSR